MVKPDYRGARGANAGYDFHELWALRQALALLDSETALTAITVEGLLAGDEAGAPRDTWDGVDCAMYYGGDQGELSRRIEIAQLKYSAATPDEPWTIARLSRSGNKRQDNSVIGRLAKAFAALKTKRPDLVESRNLVVRLISNQPVHPAVFDALLPPDSSNLESESSARAFRDRGLLVDASGLQEGGFVDFANALDLSGCGNASRFALEVRVLTTISEWTEDDARLAVDHLMRFVHRSMLPEAKGETITRSSILAHLGFSDARALFPCPSAIKRAERVVPRSQARIVCELMLGGQQQICVHGHAGCGKTTALQEMQDLLPQGSVVVIYDCYGGGRYLDSDAYRHRPADAFLQMSNDLASQLRIPLLVSKSASLDYPRALKKRLGMAAELVASRASDALLVLVVDAADNSVTAARAQSPPDKSFVPDFVSLGDLPANARLIIAARTGRLPSLNLPPEYLSVEIPGFELAETADNVRGVWNDAPDDWIEDFHHLSGGNPRVQQYALDYAGPQPAKALDCLRPDGRNLGQVFKDQLDRARIKVGLSQDIKAFCSGLIALPRPIPVSDLSAVTDLHEAHIRDLCADLAPGIRLANGLIGFSDEDFEQFIRAEAEDQLSMVQNRIADHFVTRHHSDPYAAIHIAAALLTAGRGRKIIDLISTERAPLAIGDPVLKREVQLRRLRVAMKVCRETGNDVDAMLTLLVGAEALETDATLRRMLVENPDLAANFARDTSSRIVLRDPDEIERHGPLLFHLMAVDARNGDAISVREGHRQVRAWLQRREMSYEEQKARNPHFPSQGWSISYRDIAAETEAVLLLAGPRDALQNVMRWHPRSVALRVASTIASQMIVSGQADVVERCLADGGITPPWDLFLLTPLGLAGIEIDLSRLEFSLSCLLRRGLINVKSLRDARNDGNAVSEHLDTILTACEFVIGHGGDRAQIIPVLERLADPEARRRDQLSSSQVPLIDVTLRAHSLRERLAGRKAALESYWVDPPTPSEDSAAKEVHRLKRASEEKRKELQDFIGPLVDLYDVRAQALLGMIGIGEVAAQLENAISQFDQKDYLYHRQHWASAMRARAALSITRLMGVADLDRATLFARVSTLIESRSGFFGPAQLEVLAALSLDRSLHPQILGAITAQSKAVRSMRISAEDKIAALVRFARLLLPISQADARGLFNEAAETAGDVNTGTIHEIAVFAPLVDRAVSAMGADRRRAIARDLATIVADAAIRLEGQDGFPWKQTARALTRLDVCLALAATARWEDAGIIDRHSILPGVIDTAVSHQEMSPAQALALSPLLDHFSVEVTRLVLEMAKYEDAAALNALAEELARLELLRFGNGRRPQVLEVLRSLPTADGPNYWIDQLGEATAFHQAMETSRTPVANSEEQWHRQSGDKPNQPDPLDSITWNEYRYASASEIDLILDRAIAAARSAGGYLPPSDVLDRMRCYVSIADRVAHLEALRGSQSQNVRDYDLAQAIAKCVSAWREAPSVNHWCQERLLRAIVDMLPGFSRWIVHDDSPLPTLLEASSIARDQICAALLEALEHHIDALGAPTVYALVGLIGQNCDPNDAALVAERYAHRLVQRIPAGDRESWDFTDLPSDVPGAIARFLSALMGDIDVRVRWRAAHAVRLLARLGEDCALNGLVALYDRTLERCFRAVEAPFYWLAARLWLLIAVDRIAAETPTALSPHGEWLIGIAQDDDFPHVVVRQYAKSAALKLVENRCFSLDKARRRVLDAANTSPIRPKKARKAYDVGFDRYTHRGSQDRRFHFDSMDTLPYWYTGALRSFADLGENEFLDSAEAWIVDHWGVLGDPWRWEDEPRKNRLSDRSYSLMANDHGSRPTLERYHTHLEWHAMWCATGELMRTRALAEPGEDDYYTLENRLAAEGLTSPPLWLSDLRGMKPAEERLWFPPRPDVDAWVEDVEDDDFLVELGLVSNDGSVVVSGNHSTRSRDFLESARVETAVVSPSTAGALVRALQTVSDPYSYRIPPAGDSLEIDSAPYRLIGWLADPELESGVDERDPLRYEVGPIERLPSPNTVAILNLEPVNDNPARWVDARSRATVFTYETWGDIRGDENEDRIGYTEDVRSAGWRLRVDQQALRALLHRMGLDLIVEIEITRRNTGHEYPRIDEEESKEARFDKVVLLRRDGTIETAEGRLGTWAASSK